MDELDGTRSCCLIGTVFDHDFAPVLLFDSLTCFYPSNAIPNQWKQKTKKKK